MGSFLQHDDVARECRWSY